MKKMKKNTVILMVGLLVCMLAGCGEAKEPETADEALEQIESEIEEMISEEEEEKTPEESLVDVYVPGTIPPGTYIKEGGSSTLYVYENNEFMFDVQFAYETDTYTYDENLDVYTFTTNTLIHGTQIYENDPIIHTGYFEDDCIIFTSRIYPNHPEWDAENIEDVYVRQ